MRERMKSALKHPSKKHDKITAKQEEAFYMKRYNQHDKNKMHTNYWKANLQLNLTNRNGHISRFVSNSKMQWANDCPHNNQNVNLLQDDWDFDEENIVLSNKDVDKNEIFGAETYKSVVTDRGCTKALAWKIDFKIHK